MFFFVFCLHLLVVFFFDQTMSLPLAKNVSDKDFIGPFLPEIPLHQETFSSANDIFLVQITLLSLILLLLISFLLYFFCVLGKKFQSKNDGRDCVKYFTCSKCVIKQKIDQSADIDLEMQFEK